MTEEHIFCLGNAIIFVKEFEKRKESKRAEDVSDFHISNRLFSLKGQYMGLVFLLK